MARLKQGKRGCAASEVSLFYPTRKVKDVKVFYVPFAVEFPDVTDQFTNQQ